MLKIENLVIEKSAGKRILRGLNATFEQGKLNAIMGPNGTGKSTLLDAIYGKSTDVTNVSGRILFNEQKRDSKTWNSTVSYVEQEPFFVKNQTARDLIMFSINMKNAADKTDYRLNDFEEMLKALNLNKILDIDENLLSGGEKKRVMLAIEIIQMKSILMLDELISDLDSHLAMKLLIHLKSIAVKHNIIVIMTIHQPNEHIYNQIDNTLLILKGITVYSGSTEDVSKVLESHGIVKPVNWNMAEFLFQIFYKSHISPEIVGLMPVIEEYIKKCNDIALSGSPINISQRFEKSSHDLSINIAQSGIILHRSIRTSLKKKTLYIKLLICYALYFFSIHIDTEAYFNSKLPSKMKTNEISMEDLKSKDPEYFGTLLKETTVLTMLTCYLILIVGFSPNIFDDLNQLKKEICKGFYTPTTLFVATLLVNLSTVLFDMLLFALLFFIKNILGLISLKNWICMFVYMITMRIFKACLDIMFTPGEKPADLMALAKYTTFLIFIFEFRAIFINMIKMSLPEVGKYVEKVFRFVPFIFPPPLVRKLTYLQRIKSLLTFKSENTLDYKKVELEALIKAVRNIFLSSFDENLVDSERIWTVVHLFISIVILLVGFSVIFIKSFTPKAN